MTREEINFVLSGVFKKIKNGELERGWEVYDEFEKQLTDNHDTRAETTTT